MSSLPLQKKSYRALWFVIVSVLLILHDQVFFPAAVYAKSNVYIVYMGERHHDNLDLVTDGHRRRLSEVLGSNEASVMVYSYKHGFSGLAAKLTEAQVQMFAELPDVVQVIPNRLHKLQTTRSWDYLGLPLDSPTSLLHETKMGDGTIIGLLDTGIWPESEVFTDEGLGPVPS